MCLPVLKCGIQTMFPTHTMKCVVNQIKLNHGQLHGNCKRGIRSNTVWTHVWTHVQIRVWTTLIECHSGTWTLAWTVQRQEGWRTVSTILWHLELPHVDECAMGWHQMAFQKSALLDNTNLWKEIPVPLLNFRNCSILSRDMHTFSASHWGSFSWPPSVHSVMQNKLASQAWHT